FSNKDDRPQVSGGLHIPAWPPLFHAADLIQPRPAEAAGIATKQWQIPARGRMASTCHIPKFIDMPHTAVIGYHPHRHIHNQHIHNRPERPPAPSPISGIPICAQLISIASPPSPSNAPTTAF